MARPLRIEYEGAFYHVTARGNERRKIYWNERDFEKFKEYLKESQKKYGYRLHCYVLMTNHYHLLIETPEANLGQVMHYINGSYTTYINTKRNRSGHLFQGRYKAIVVEHDRYLLELSRYMHLNPVRAKMVAKPGEYKHSSYNAYVSRKGEDIVYRDLIIEMISNQRESGVKRYREFVEAGLRSEIENPLKNIYGGMILGSSQFIKEVLGRLKDGLLMREDISHKRELKRTIGAEEIIDVATRHFKMSKEEMMAGRNGKRNIIIYLIKKYTGMTNREAGRIVGGMNSSAVGKMNQRFCGRLNGDGGLRKEVDRIEKQMSDVGG
jgi:REP element-mobilizing transposase RayT